MFVVRKGPWGIDEQSRLQSHCELHIAPFLGKNQPDCRIRDRPKCDIVSCYNPPSGEQAAHVQRMDVGIIHEIGEEISKLKTTHTPSRNGSYGIKGGWYTILSVESLLILRAIRTQSYGIFWGHIFANMGGWGWSELFSRIGEKGKWPSNPVLESQLPLLVAPYFERKQKGGFVKGWFWRMHPRSGFWYCRSDFGGSVALFFVPSFLFLGSREYPPKSPFGNHLFTNPRVLRGTPRLCQRYRCVPCDGYEEIACDTCPSSMRA